jgi:hypothetical protein
MIDPARYENGPEAGMEPQSLCLVCLGCLGCLGCHFCDGCPDAGLDADDLDPISVVDLVDLADWGRPFHPRRAAGPAELRILSQQNKRYHGWN